MHSSKNVKFKVSLNVTEALQFLFVTFYCMLAEGVQQGVQEDIWT